MEDNKKTIVLKFNTEEHTIDMNFSPDLTDEMEIGYILSSSFCHLRLIKVLAKKYYMIL